MKTVSHSVRAVAVGGALAAAACGPAVLGAGIDDLRNGTPRSETIVLVIVNDSDEPVTLAFDGLAVDGNPIASASDPIAPGATVNLTLTRAQALRVRAAQQALDFATAPVVWDFRVDQPGDETTLRLGVEGGVPSGVRATAQEGEQLAFDRLVGDQTAASFERTAGGGLDFSPDRFAVHPCGAYVYAIEDNGGGSAAISAFRFDATTGALQLIEPEFAHLPANPRGIDYAGDFAELEAFVEPLGRVLYVVQRQPAQTLSVVTVLPLLADGSLGEPESVLRGLIGDLAVRADGRRLYLSEDLGEGAGFVLRDYALDADGRIATASGAATQPCVSTVGGRFALHPSGRFLYAGLERPVTPQDPEPAAQVGAFFVGDNGGILFVNRDCDGFSTLVDLQVDAAGEFLFATGLLNGQRRVVRYRLDPTSGSLAQTPEEQDLGSVSRLATTDDPQRPNEDPLRRVVWLAVDGPVAADDTLVPHLRQPDGTLQPIATGSSLAFGSAASAFFVRGIRRGSAVVTRP